MVRVIVRLCRTTVILLAGLLIALAPTGCGAQDGSEPDAHELVRTAVTAADSAIVAIPEISTRTNGLGRAMMVSLVIDRGAALTADELRTITAAIWVSSPFRPNAIRLVAAGPDGDAIDLTPAAEALMPGGWGRFGDGGVTLIGMSGVLGERPS